MTKKQTIKQLAETHLAESLPAVEQLLALSEVQNTVPNVVVYGVYNSGKSSLLNSLVDRVDPEYFKTRDIPETRTNKTFKKNGICYVDTPGLDVNEQDTAMAQQGVYQADIVLFVHKLSAGPLQKDDLAMMKAITKNHGNKDHLFLVLTEAELAQQNQSLIQALADQAKQALSISNPPVLVSNTMYQKGVKIQKVALKQASGIPELQQRLQAIAKTNIANNRQKKVEQVKGAISIMIFKKLLESTKALAEIEERTQSKQRGFVHEVHLLREQLVDQMKTIQSL